MRQFVGDDRLQLARVQEIQRWARDDEDGAKVIAGGGLGNIDDFQHVDALAVGGSQDTRKGPDLLDGFRRQVADLSVVGDIAGPPAGPTPGPVLAGR